MERASGKAVSKVILCGEHFVVHGCPALAAPLPHLTLQVDLMEAGESNLDDPLVDHALEVCQKHMAGPGRGLALYISSEIPLASGLGSSAALSVALARAYSHFMGTSLEAEQIYEISMEIEARAHGKPSGIDSTVVTYERPIRFVKGVGLTFLKTAQKVGMVVVDSREPSHTRKMVEGVWKFKEENPDTFASLFDRACTLVEEFHRSLKEGDVPSIGKLARENHQLLRLVGVHSEGTDRAAEAIEKAGARGAKMSGGGGGGVVLGFVEVERLFELEENLKGSEFSVLTTGVV